MALLRLPPEIIDSILGQIDRVDHLAAFARASKECASHATPRHTQYRIIHSAAPNYPVWAHLAMHATLARNVRQVFLLNKLCPDRCPTTLVAPLDFDEAAPDAEPKYMRALCRSLISMDLLTTFVWLTAPTSRYPFKDLRWEYLLFDILRRNHSHLRHLFLSGGFGASTHDIIHDPQSTKYPVTISPLLSFTMLTNR